MPPRPPKTTPVVVKRPSEERKRLPPELEAFARSDEEKLRIRRPRQDKGKVNDPREGYTIPGVANRDARAVYDQRVLAMQALWREGSADEAGLSDLGAHLLDAQRLGLWRARRVMDFEAFAEEVVGVPHAQARALLEAASVAQRESPAQLNERDVALWLRTEAGLHEGDAAPRVRIVTTSGKPRLEISVAMANVSEALSGAGVRHAPLARPIEERLAELQQAQRPSPSRAIDKARGRSAMSAAERELEELLAEVDARGEAEPEGAEPGSSGQEASDASAAGGERVVGGARLLTRKALLAREDAAFGSEAGEEHEAAAPVAHSERARGREQERGGARPERGHGSGGRSFERGEQREFARAPRRAGQGEFERPRRAGRGGDFARPTRERAHAGRGEPLARGRTGGAGAQRGSARDQGGPRRRHGDDERPAFAAKKGGFAGRGGFEKKGGFAGKGGFEKKGGFAGKGGFEKKGAGFGEKRVFERGGQARPRKRDDDPNE